MSGSADNAIGMMDGAYFTGRTELLDFFNKFLQLNLSKIEQTASGAVACQLIDYIFPGSIPMKRVNWEAKNSYEFIANYKLLQSAFNKNRIQKYVDVDKLIRAKYQDNLEFCQWLKAFFDQAAPSERAGYDPVAVRSKGKGGKTVEKKYEATAARNRTPKAKDRVLPLTNRTRRSPVSSANPSTAKTRTAHASSSAKSAATTASRKTQKTAADKPKSSPNMEAVVADANLMKLNSELTSRNAELEMTVSQVEKERDFYFEKLRDVELMLQVHEEKGEASESSAVIKRIFKVLYATADDEIRVDENGEIVGDDSIETENALNDIVQKKDSVEEPVPVPLEEPLQATVKEPVQVPVENIPLAVDTNVEILCDEPILQPPKSNNGLQEKENINNLDLESSLSLAESFFGTV